jgi:quinol monooxygenase YgiN
MIVRISRARIKPQSESAVFDVLRGATADNTRPPGMHSIMIGRRMDETGNELIAITVWTDVEALQSVMGQGYQTAQFFPALDPYLLDPTVEHFETVVETFEDLKSPTT